MKSVMAVMMGAAAWLLTACGGGDGASAPAQCERLVSIQVAPQGPLSSGSSDDQLPLGASAQFEATLTYCDGSTRVTTDGVAWSTSNPNATVSAKGVVSAVAAGEVDIIATLDNLTGSRALSISDAPLVGLTLTPPTATVPVGLTQPYRVQGQYADGTAFDLTHAVTWALTNPAIATVDEAGVATGKVAGATFVVALYQGLSAEARLTVSDATLTTLTITPQSRVLPAGLIEDYKVYGTYSDGQYKNVTELATWESSDTVVATVDRGAAQALAEGEVDITARVMGLTARAHLSVTGAVLTGLSVSPATASVPAGLTQPFIATATYSAGEPQDVTALASWSSSAPEVASVDDTGANSGQVHALLAGEGQEAVITATFEGRSAEATVSVTAPTLTSLTVSPPSATVSIGQVQPFQVLATYSNGAVADVTDEVTWRSEDSNVAVVTPVADQDGGNLAGDAQGMGAGETEVVALLDGQSARASLYVTSPGPVVGWGKFGGTDLIPSTLSDQLTQVKSVFGLKWELAVLADNSRTIVAITDEGKVVTWGGGAVHAISGALQGRLKGVNAIVSTLSAFAALRTDGQVVAWGARSVGGDDAKAQLALDKRPVRSLLGNNEAFAALTRDGKVATWGEAAAGGNNTAAQTALGDATVRALFNTEAAFAALTTNGEVRAWGNVASGGNSSAVQADLTEVVTVFSTDLAFAALKRDGSVVAWGSVDDGGDNDAAQAAIDGKPVRTLVANARGFAALLQDGSVVTWGDPAYGGDCSAVREQLGGDVVAIGANYGAFAALKADGSVVTWGYAEHGGDSTEVSGQLQSGVVAISATARRGSAFAAFKSDGSVVTWGSSREGGDSSQVSGLTDRGVVRLFSNRGGFAALKADGTTLVTWGDVGLTGPITTSRRVQTVFSAGTAFVALLEADASQ